jgi:hypothetical protein
MLQHHHQPFQLKDDRTVQTYNIERDSTVDVSTPSSTIQVLIKSQTGKKITPVLKYIYTHITG